MQNVSQASANLVTCFVGQGFNLAIITRLSSAWGDFPDTSFNPYFQARHVTSRQEAVACLY